MLQGLPVLLLNANIRESLKYCLEDFVCQRGTPTTFAGIFTPLPHLQMSANLTLGNFANKG